MGSTKKALTDKRLRVIDATALPEEGSFDEPTEVLEYAVDYDAYDWESQYLGADEPGDPVNWKYRPTRIYLSSGWRSEEKVVELGRFHAKSGSNAQTGRPARIIRRKVTYGPWEVIEEVSE